MREKAKVMTEEEIRRVLVRISHEILEKDHNAINDLVLIGVKSRGDHLAYRIAKIIERVEGVKVPVGIIDANLYRDDINLHTAKITVSKTDIPFDVAGKWIILVDDVLYTGRTIRASMEAVMDFGRPAVIQLEVLIDRGHRELPIAADYVGKNIQTSTREIIRVDLEEEGNTDLAIIYETD